MKQLINFLIFILIMMSATIFTSCSNDADNDLKHSNELKTTTTLLFNHNSNKFSSKSDENLSKNTTEHNVELSFVSVDPIPVFATDEEIKAYLKENESKMNGIISFKIDGLTLFESKVINGKKTKLIEHDNSFLSKIIHVHLMVFQDVLKIELKL